MTDPILHLKCPYCARWFRIADGDLDKAVNRINRHIGHQQSHHGRPLIRIVRLTSSLLAYIKKD